MAKIIPIQHQQNVEQKKLKRFANTIKPIPEVHNSPPGKTIPGMVMSIAEVAERFIRGQNVDQRQAIYQEGKDFALGLDTFEAIDKARKEMEELRVQYQAMLKKSAEIKSMKEEAEKLSAKRARKQKIEEAMEQKLADEFGVK